MSSYMNQYINHKNGKITTDYGALRRAYSANPSDFDAEMCVPNEAAVTLKFVILLVIFFIGIVLNAVVIWMIVILREYKKTAHWYVLHLAIADAIFLIMLPLKATHELKGIWMFSAAACHAHQTVFYVNYYASIFFLTAMSFDRYAAILHPVSPRWRQMRSFKGSLVIVVMVWIWAILACIPVLRYSTILNCNCGFKFPISFEDHCNFIQQTNLTACRLALDGLDTAEETLSSKFSEFNYDNSSYEDIEASVEEYYKGFENFTFVDDFEKYEIECKHPPSYYYKNWSFANLVLAFLLPVAIMIICYGCILWRVTHPRVRRSNPTVSYSHTKQSSTSSTDGSKSISKKAKTSTSSTGPSSSSSNRKTYRITVLVIVLVVSFIVCWLPFHVIQLARFYGLNLGRSCSTLSSIARYMAFFNSVLNPFLYTFMNVNFGRRFQTAWNSFTQPFQNGSHRSSSAVLKSNGSRLSRGSNVTGGKFTKETLVTDGTAVSTNNQPTVLKLMNSDIHNMRTDEVATEMKLLILPHN